MFFVLMPTYMTEIGNVKSECLLHRLYLNLSGGKVGGNLLLIYLW